MNQDVSPALPAPNLSQGLDLVLPPVGPDQQRYLLKGLQGAANTQRAYRSDLSQYQAFCDRQGLVALPATPAVLGQYATHLAPLKKWSTIARHLASIAKWHELHELESPLSDRWLKATLNGIQREHGTHARQSPAFSVAQLKAVILGLETQSGGVPRLVAVRDKLVLLLGFMGAFRRSELVGLQVQRVSFTEDCAIISYYGSKTNQRGEIEEKAFFYSPDPLLCPVRALRAWIELLGRVGGPLLVRVEKGNWLSSQPLGASTIDKIVKRRLGAGYSAHSLRASFVTAAKLKGAQDSEIMQQTGHKTPAMIRRYTRLDSIKEHNAAKKLDW